MVLICLAACSDNPDPVPTPSMLGVAGPDFANATLKQSNPQGQLLWQLHAQRIAYGADPDIAQVHVLRGHLYENGQPTLQLDAADAEVQQTTQQMMLKGAVVVKDLNNGIVVQGGELEWSPEREQLKLRTQVTLRHPQVLISASGVQVNRRTQQVNLHGNVAVDIKTPKFNLTTNRVIWRLDQQRFQIGTEQGDRTIPTVKIEQQANLKTPNHAFAGSVQVNLHTQTLTLQNPAQIYLTQPPIQITSDRLVWDLLHQRLHSDRLIQIQHRTQGLSVLANSGYVDQIRQVVRLQGDVELIDRRDRLRPALGDGVRLQTDQLTWAIPRQQVEAKGQVHYQQLSPPISLQGARAVGNLQTQTIDLSGGDVVTEVVSSSP